MNSNLLYLYWDMHLLYYQLQVVSKPRQRALWEQSIQN